MPFSFLVSAIAPLAGAAVQVLAYPKIAARLTGRLRGVFGGLKKGARQDNGKASNGMETVRTTRLQQGQPPCNPNVLPGGNVKETARFCRGAGFLNDIKGQPR